MKNNAEFPQNIRTHFKFLSAANKWLYVCLCDLCPDDNLYPFSLRKLEQETNISKSGLGRMIPQLIQFGVVRAEKKVLGNATLHEVWHLSPIRFTDEQALALSNKYEQSLKGKHIDLTREITRIESHLIESQRLNRPSTLLLVEWLETLEHFDFKCSYCQGKYELIEHFIPISLGSGTTKDNCVPACRSCNSKKNSYHPLLLPQSLNMNEAIERVGIYLQKQVKG